MSLHTPAFCSIPNVSGVPLGLRTQPLAHRTNKVQSNAGRRLNAWVEQQRRAQTPLSAAIAALAAACPRPPRSFCRRPSPPRTHPRASRMVLARLLSKLRPHKEGDLAPGTVVAGRYRVLHPLGRGAWSAMCASGCWVGGWGAFRQGTLYAHWSPTDVRHPAAMRWSAWRAGSDLP